MKTTTGNAEDNFFLSSSEIEKAKECLNNGLKYELHYLAFRLGLRTRERARQICAGNEPLKKHILALATQENISIEEFKSKYSTMEVIKI